MERKTIKKADILIIISLVLVAGLFYFFYFNKKAENYDAVYARIFINGSEYRVITLNENTPDETITPDPALTNNISVTLEVKDGKIGFVNAQCPDKICEHTGFIQNPNESAICLPAKVSVMITED